MLHDKHTASLQYIKNTQLTKETYDKWYQSSIKTPEAFWGEHAKQLISWEKPWETVLAGDFHQLNVQWFVGATLNATYNCLDRHLPERADQIAILWEGDDPRTMRRLSYKELYEATCRLANALKAANVKAGDRVCIYLPMIPEAVIAMLACARIGAIHSVVFAGFSSAALKTRILDAKCRVVITATQAIRGNKIVPLKAYVDEALQDCMDVETVFVIKHTENSMTNMHPKRDLWYHEAIAKVTTDCPCVPVNSHHPLFILYTSGSTGKPKGIEHATAGYLIYAAMTFKYIFDYQDHEIFWSSADVGWVTGHTYSVYGPLVNGATIVLYEGVPNYPTPARFWEVIDKYQVNIFYTAPTAIRALRKEGEKWLQTTSRESLRLLGSVGEPINPEAWEWYYHQVGKGRCPIVDTWWQTETGGVMISPLPGAGCELKPGSAAWPFFGVKPAIVDDDGRVVASGVMGKLIMTQPWPGMMQTIYNDTERFKATYFEEFRGCYSTGDQATCDADGYYWIAGRSDDVIKISGHRIGTEEVESALVGHEAVAEAAVIPIPDEVKGQSIYAYVILKTGIAASDKLKTELINTVRNIIGPIATPKTIQLVDALPKTRSGKIMRRLLRKIAVQEFEDLGDLSTLADPQVIESLIKEIKGV